MDHTMGILMIGAACLLVLLVAAMRSKTQTFLNFILRAVLGLLLIRALERSGVAAWLGKEQGLSRPSSL